MVFRQCMHVLYIYIYIYIICVIASKWMGEEKKKLKRKKETDLTAKVVVGRLERSN